MTVRLWCYPGVTFELGQLTVLIAPPERMAALLEAPEIAHFRTRYLHPAPWGVLIRVPPTRSERFEAVACATLDEMTAEVRFSIQTVLVVEWDPALAGGIEVEERGRRMARFTAALKRRAGSSIVIVYAPAMDGALRQVSAGADQTTWLVPRPAELRATLGVAARGTAQRTLAGVE